MPIFTRRRLQAMMNDMASHLSIPKLNDLKARLENKRVEQVLPAEIELSVLWSLSAMGSLEIEPEWYGSRRPDAFTEHLFDGCPCVVEITAISDARLSQEDDMRRIATRLCEAANKMRKGWGKHLHFQFTEESGYTDAGYVRRRKVDKVFEPESETVEALRVWLFQDGQRQSLSLTQGRTHVVVSWHDRPVHPHSNFFSSMPAEAYSLESNPLYEALKAKAEQLINPDFEGLRCVVVADVGSRMLRHQNESMRTQGTVTGSQVITHFLARSAGAADAVLTLSPYRNSTLFAPEMEPIHWRAALYVRPDLKLPESGIEKMVSLLPKPRFEGYQARSLQQQAAYRYDARGWYIGTSISSGRSKVTIKVSARAVLDLLAGRITQEQFHYFTGLDGSHGHPNIFKHRLEQGDVLSGVRLETGGVDQDDDWLVMELKWDPSAAMLRIPTIDQ